MTEMRVRCERPPLFDLIDAKFFVAGKPVIFAWGDTIFNPEGIKIPSVLFAHEEVHGERQIEAGVECWWNRYLMEPLFRFDEELLAHRAEYRAYRKLHGPCSRTAKYLDTVAAKLASPLYGSLRPFDECRHAILTGA